jgi:hypothetical protein
VIELSQLDGIKNKHEQTEKFQIQTSFEFWSKRSMRNVTNLSNKKIINTNEFFELHSQISLDNVDITEWNSDTLVQFRIGIHNTRTQRDWLIINLKYPQSKPTIDAWTCIDA